MTALDVSPYPAVSLFDTEAITLTSKAGIEYEISVWLPPGYAAGQKAYPVVYVLDGNVNFGLATGITRTIVLGQEVPGVIIVGIGYRIASYEDWFKYRERDYDAVPDPSRPDDRGGVPPFLEFIETGLIPFIESNYRADPADRTLQGYSLGGNLVLYALLTRPALFKRYIAGDPAIGLATLALFTAEMGAARDRPTVPVKVAISRCTAVEAREHTETFWTRLRQRDFEGLELKTIVLEGETHASGGAASYLQGLKAVFG